MQPAANAYRLHKQGKENTRKSMPVLFKVLRTRAWGMLACLKSFPVQCVPGNHKIKHRHSPGSRGALAAEQSASDIS